jgi:hypothetical protein
VGSFYTNVTVRVTDEQAVQQHLASKDQRAFVSRTEGSALVVFGRDSEDQDYAVLCDLAADLSTQFKCVALAVMNHDDDVLLYTLYQRGRAIDAYNSAPAYFDEDRSAEDRGGDAQRLADAFNVPDQASQIEAALRRESGTDDGVVFETDRHAQLVEALASPKCAVGTGYNYLDAQEYPEDYAAEDFTQVGEG